MPREEALTSSSKEVCMSDIKLVGYGVDTLILNVRYSDSKGQPVKQELDEKLVQELDYLQGEARRGEKAGGAGLGVLEVVLVVGAHRAGKKKRGLVSPPVV